MLNRVFDLKPSLTYQLIIAIVLFICSIVMFTLPISIFLIFLGIAGIAVYGRYLFSLARKRGRLVYTKDAKWLLEADGHVTECILRGDSTVTAYVSILRWQVVGQRLVKNLVIFRDSLAPDEYRQLMVIIRMY